MLETILPYLFLSGVAIAAIGFIALVVTAFRVKASWGFGVLLIPPLGIVFAIKHFRPAWIPSTLIALGVVLACFPPLYTRLMPIDLGPREKIVNDELHITLTGWDRKDYSPLKLKSDVVVLQMANSDVNDATLALVKDFRKLRELDLNDSMVTDAGLNILKTFPALETLRVRNTAITDGGFTESVAPMESLKQIDVRGTQISKESVQVWKENKPGRRAMQ